MRRWLLPLLALTIAAVLVLLDRARRNDGAAEIDGGSRSFIGSARRTDGDIEAPQPEAPPRVAVDGRGDSVAARAAEDLSLELLVRDDTGAPVTLVACQLWRLENGRAVREGRQELSMASARGRYRLHSMTRGVWIVVVDGEPSGTGREPLTVDLPYEGPPLEVVLRRPGELSGRVEDADGNQLSGVKVSGWFSERHLRLRRQTDEHGEFQLGAVPAGQWSLSAGLRGASTEQRVEVLPGLDSYHVLRFGPAGVIAGLVLNEGGQPLAGWRVTLIGGSPNEDRRVTDEGGRFRFSPVQPGTYTLFAVGHRSEHGTRAPPPGSRTTGTAVVVASETIEVTLEVLAVTPVEVFGTLTLGGEPVAAVRVFAFREGELTIGVPRSARTDGLGRYSLRLPGPGAVLLRADTSWASATLSLVHVPPGPRFRHDMTLPAGSVSGELSDTQGYPWRWEVTLELEDGSLAPSSAGPRAKFKVDNDGSFLFPAVHAGTYVLRAHGGAGWSVAPLHGILVAEGQEVSGLELTARPGGALSGRVTDVDGEPVAGAEVFVRDLTGTQLVSELALTNSQGLYSIAALPAGRVLVSAQTEDGAALVEARVAAESSREVDLRLAPGTVVTFSAVDGEGALVPAVFSVFGPRGDHVTALIGPGLRASSRAIPRSFSTLTLGPLPPGTYRVVARAADGRRAAREVKLGGEPSSKLALEVR